MSTDVATQQPPPATQQPPPATQQPPPEAQYGSLRFARQSMIALGRTVGIIDPEEEEKRAENNAGATAQQPSAQQPPTQQPQVQRPPKSFHQSLMYIGQTVGLVDSDDEDDLPEYQKPETPSATTAAKQQQSTPDILSGDQAEPSMWRRSIAVVSGAIGLDDSDDSDDEKEDKKEAEEKDEKKKEKETPEDTLSLPDSTTHRRLMLAKKRRLKEKRQIWMMAGATGGAIAGGLILFPVFPVGMILGGGAGAAGTKAIHKHREKKKLKKLDRKLMQHTCTSLPVEDHPIT